MGLNQVIALKEGPSFSYSYVKVQVIDNIFIKIFTNCVWHVNLLDMNYEIESLLHSSMLAKVLKLYETDATCCVLNADFIIGCSEMVNRTGKFCKFILLHTIWKNKTLKEQNHLNKVKVKTKWYHANLEVKIIYHVKVSFRKYVGHFSMNIRSYFS